MKALTLIVVVGDLGSFDVTVIDFVCLFFLMPVLKVTLIVPSPPGGMAVLVRTAAVHPQVAFALIRRSGALPVFFTMKLWLTRDPRAMVPKSCTASGK